MTVRLMLRRWAIRALSKTHLVLYRATRGRVLGSAVGMPVLLLTTTGRRSGTARTTPLTFLRDGSDLVVVASNGGADRAPAWSLNLQHNPRATVQIGAHALRITARQASAGERKRLWPVITAAYSGYARYQKRTTRHIPVVLLTPLVPPGGLSGGGEVPCHAPRGERLPRCGRRGARMSARKSAGWRASGSADRGG
ncbi:MAG: nitroreductase family deazaflavin-dependent oxidoreductase [Gaiella sp.]